MNKQTQVYNTIHEFKEALEINFTLKLLKKQIGQHQSRFITIKKTCRETRRRERKKIEKLFFDFDKWSIVVDEK